MIRITREEKARMDFTCKRVYQLLQQPTTVSHGQRLLSRVKRVWVHPKMGAKKQGPGFLFLTETITDHKKQDSYRFVNQKGIKNTCATVQKRLCEGGTQNSPCTGKASASLHRFKMVDRNPGNDCI
jgi:hypothetical protein